MHTRILDLDGALLRQRGLVRRFQPTIHDLGHWGPRIRLGCRFGAFERFERDLALALDADEATRPALTFIGSGDFHHISLALLRRLREPFNLLILDNHPDWMRGVPLLHCGTWVHHAARLPLCQRIFHVGGTRDFDNGYQWLTPWSLLRSEKITVIPAVNRFTKGTWKKVPHTALRTDPDRPAGVARVAELLWRLRPELRRVPLYISLDKDVLVESDAAVNWDSGRLTLAEVKLVLENFRRAAGDRLAGVDIVGDASPIEVAGWPRRLFNWLEKSNRPELAKDAARRNQRTNLALMPTLGVAAPVLPLPRPRRVGGPQPLSA